MRLPNQPPKYEQHLEQQRSAEIERQIQQILAELSRLKTTTDDHEARIVVLEP
jgi:hypothetical protein